MQGVISRELTMDDTTTSDTGGPRNSRGIEMGESGLIDSDTSRARLRRDSSLENPTTDLTPQQIRCHKVCKEIIATERSFARNMQTLQEVFYKGLKDQTHLIADSDLVNIFQHVESVLGVSTSLLDHFDEEQAATLKNEGKRMMKLTLTERTVKTYKFIEPYLKMYAAFCNHYEESMETLRHAWTENNKLKKWLDKARHDPRCMGLGVVDLLIQPVQRICKYPLLFGELLKHMEDTDELKQMLEETYILIKEVTFFLIYLFFIGRYTSVLCSLYYIYVCISWSFDHTYNVFCWRTTSNEPMWRSGSGVAGWECNADLMCTRMHAGGEGCRSSSRGLHPAEENEWSECMIVRAYAHHIFSPNDCSHINPSMCRLVMVLAASHFCMCVRVCSCLPA